jgi:hypothetical protein
MSLYQLKDDLESKRRHLVSVSVPPHMLNILIQSRCRVDQFLNNAKIGDSITVTFIRLLYAENSLVEIRSTIDFEDAQRRFITFYNDHTRPPAWLVGYTLETAELYVTNHPRAPLRFILSRDIPLQQHENYILYRGKVHSLCYPDVVTTRTGTSRL